MTTKRKSAPKQTKIPGATQLAGVISFHDETIRPKCDHSAGRWLVAWQGKLYGLAFNNNLTMGNWQAEAQRDGLTKEQAEQCLRWHCFYCNNLQMP